MYARRYSEQEEKRSVRVPENYNGNAFRKEEMREDLSLNACEEKQECGACEHEPPKEECHCEKESKALLPFFNGKILSSDALLLLLAFLLMGNGECDDLPGILIFLMLL